MKPGLTEFGMQLPYGIIYAYNFGIYEFPIFSRVLGIFLQKLSFLGTQYIDRDVDPFRLAGEQKIFRYAQIIGLGPK